MKKKNVTFPVTPGTFADLFEERARLEAASYNLLLTAAKRLAEARKGYSRPRIEAILELSKNTLEVAENPRIDKPSKKFSLERTAELYSATVKAVEALRRMEAEKPSTSR